MKHLTGGVKLDTLRRAAGLTHEELAAESGVPYKTIQRACAGRAKLLLPHFLRVMRALRVRDVVKVFPPEDFE